MNVAIINKLQMAQGWLASARVDAIEQHAAAEDVEKIETVEDQLRNLIDTL